MKPKYDAWALKWIVSSSGEWFIAPWTVQNTRRIVIANFEGEKKGLWRKARRTGKYKMVKVKLVEVK